VTFKSIRLQTIGRLLYGLALFGFAVLYFIYATHRHGPIPGPPWAPGRISLAWLTAIFFFVIAICFRIAAGARAAAALVAAVLLLKFAFLQFPVLVRQLHSPGPWTSSFEVLALCGGALVLAAGKSNSLTRALTNVGCWFFAALMVVVAVQHFMYAHFVAALVPAWIPARLFWAYFVGVAFFATALSQITRVLAHSSAKLIGVMFLIFVAIVHAPRVAGAIHNGNEWTSLLVALAMAGTAFILAEA
jgi:hypothetical protein